jgi:hypothetical protein
MTMLQGDAKRDYMRDYMRRKRAGEPTRTPKAEKPVKPWQPTERMIRNVRHWFSRKLTQSSHLRGIGRKVVAGLEPHNEDGSVNEAAWDEALQRYRTLRAERRVEHKRTQEILDAPPPPKRCSFCGEPRSEDRLLVGDGRYQFICEPCTKEAVAAFAKFREIDLARDAG